MPTCAWLPPAPARHPAAAGWRAFPMCLPSRRCWRKCWGCPRLTTRAAVSGLFASFRCSMHCMYACTCWVPVQHALRAGAHTRWLPPLPPCSCRLCDTAGRRLCARHHAGADQGAPLRGGREGAPLGLGCAAAVGVCARLPARPQPPPSTRPPTSAHPPNTSLRPPPPRRCWWTCWAAWPSRQTWCSGQRVRRALGGVCWAARCVLLLCWSTVRLQGLAQTRAMAGAVR